MKYARVRYSKTLSTVGLIVGLCFFIAGIIYVIPEFGAFGIVWTLMAFMMTILHAVNFFSQRGVSLTEIEVDDEHVHREIVAKLPFDEQLRRLENLRKDNLISEQEYKNKRRDLMRSEW